MTASAREFVVWTLVPIFTTSLLVVSSSSEANPRRATPMNAVQEGVIKLADSNIEYFNQGKGAPIVLLPFGSLTVGYLEGPSQVLATAGYRVVRIYRLNAVPRSMILWGMGTLKFLLLGSFTDSSFPTGTGTTPQKITGFSN